MRATSLVIVATSTAVAAVATFWVLAMGINRFNMVRRSVPGPEDQHEAPAEQFSINLEKNRDASQIPVSGATDWDPDWLSLWDPKVDIKFPGGQSYQFDLFSIDFHRVNGEIILVRMNFYDSSVDDAYRLATQLADDWKLPKDKIEAWKRNVPLGKWDGQPVEVIDNAQLPRVDLEIRRSYEYRGSRPVCVFICLTWPWD